MNNRRVGWSLVCLATLVCAACGFDSSAPPAPGQTSAGTAATSAGSSAIAGSSASTGGAAGSATMPTAGGGGSAQGGQVTQGGTSASVAGTGGTSAAAGSGGVSVAGGPPVYTNKPMSVVAYSPYRDGQAPGGAQPSKEQVRADLELLKPYVDGVRVYGTDGANAYIPALCDELGIDLHIGAWIDGLASDEPNVHALADVVNENHPSIKTAIVGNEVLQRAATNKVTEARLIELIGIYKADVTNTTVKTAAADTYPVWMAMRPNLAAAVDIVIWHTYGWWAGINIEGAYPLVSKRYDDMFAAYPNKPLILGETGWPSMYDHMSADGTTTAVGSAENQARFYREALAGMRARNLPMWMFSAIDEKWKGTSGEGMVGAYWGIWDSQRQPKAAVAELMK
jgi:exo-beta-1,3-glucanase (GH17 family)